VRVPAPASGLGSAVGESSGSTSYHMRQLETYGFVEEVEGRGDGAGTLVAGPSSDDQLAVASMSDYALQLTPQQARALTDELDAVATRWMSAHPGEPRPRGRNSSSSSPTSCP
jgi:hypothetical protein